MTLSLVTWPYVLHPGHVTNPAHGACAMDAINWLVHGKHGDKPECVCPVIRAFVIVGNDLLPHDIRQRLLPFLPRIAGSRSQAHEFIRANIISVSNSLGAFQIDSIKHAAWYLIEKTSAGPTWDSYFKVLNDALNAGPQGEPWSADVVNAGVERYKLACGLVI